MTEQTKRMVAKISDYQRTFNSEHGKRVLFDILKRGHIARTTYHHVRGNLDPYHTIMKEGERALALFIWEKMKFKEHELFDFINSMEKEESHERRNKYSVVQ